MSVRSRHEEATILSAAGRIEGALLSALLAAAATAQKRFPRQGRRGEDRRAFESFVETDLYPAIGGGNWTYTSAMGTFPLKEVLYRHARCQLVHESELDPMLSCMNADWLLEVRGPNGNLIISDKFVATLLEVIRKAPENIECFPNCVYDALPSPPRLQRMMYVEWTWGTQHFIHLSSKAELVELPWLREEQKVWWLHCDASQQFQPDGRNVERGIRALLPAAYITKCEVGPEFKIAGTRDRARVGVFPPDHQTPGNALSLDAIRNVISSLQLSYPTQMNISVIYPDLRFDDLSKITRWSPKLE